MKVSVTIIAYLLRISAHFWKLFAPIDCLTKEPKALDVPNVKVKGIKTLIFITIPIADNATGSFNLPTYIIVNYQIISSMPSDKNEGIMIAKILQISWQVDNYS